MERFKNAFCKMDNKLIVSSTEIIRDKLYFATLYSGFEPKSTKNSKYFHIEDEIVYESFYFDFGPYHLCHLYQFCRKLNKELAEASKSQKIVFYTCKMPTLRLNAAYLIGSYAIIYLGKSPKWIYNQLVENSCHWSLLGFRDASGGASTFDVLLLDVFQGLQLAFEAGFFNFDDFDEAKYLFYEKVENGDLNWIIPQKMLAFSGPHAKSKLDRGYQLHSPETYHRYFRENNVTTIVRLNKERYDARQFSAHGFEHKDLFFIDGSAPTDEIVDRFIKICEAAPGAIAVHCKAGLGRTGTLIGCYLMRKHGFTARQAIAWIRLCRPGSVIGLQQDFLEHIQARMLAEGEVYRKKRSITSLPKFKQGIYSLRPPEPLSNETENVENKANDNIRNKEKPVSLNSILNNVCNTALNNNVRAARKTNKLHTAAGQLYKKSCTRSGDHAFGPENNIAPPSIQKKSNANPILVTAETGYIPKMNFMLPTNNIRNSNNTNLKVNARPKKEFPSILVSTFPPMRSSSISLSKMQSTKAPLKNASLKTYPRKTTVTTRNNNNNNGDDNENSADVKNGNVEVKTITTQHKTFYSDPKKSVRSVSNTRKRVTKIGDFNSNIDLSGSDTTVTNLSVDSLEVSPSNERIRRKRDKSKSPEPTFLHAAIADESSRDNFEETANSQGHRLYKIKAMRDKCAIKKDAVARPRVGNPPPGGSAKKK